MSAEAFDNSLETSYDTPETEQSSWNSQDFEATAQMLAQIRAEEQADRNQEQANVEGSSAPEDILTDIDETASTSVTSVDSDLHKGSGIDDAQETLTIEDIETQIADILQKIEALEADADNLTEEQWIELDELYQRLAELENQKQALGQQILAEEKSETAAQEAVIEAENGKQEEQEVAIGELNDEIVDGFDDINNTLDNN